MPFFLQQIKRPVYCKRAGFWSPRGCVVTFFALLSEAGYFRPAWVRQFEAFCSLRLEIASRQGFSGFRFK